MVRSEPDGPLTEIFCHVDRRGEISKYFRASNGQTHVTLPLGMTNV
jgi:hypothetical protein